MTQYRYYIGTTAGESWEHSFWKDKVFTREEVEENIETVRQLYNLDVAGKIGETVDAYTIYEGVGFWAGVKEKTIILEILVNNMDSKWFAEALATYCKQDCVMVTAHKVECDVWN